MCQFLSLIGLLPSFVLLAMNENCISIYGNNFVFPPMVTLKYYICFCYLRWIYNLKNLPCWVAYDAKYLRSKGSVTNWLYCTKLLFLFYLVVIFFSMLTGQKKMLQGKFCFQQNKSYVYRLQASCSHFIEIKATILATMETGHSWFYCFKG